MLAQREINNVAGVEQVATLVKADWLFLLTDVDHLYTDNPNTNPNAKPIYEVPDMGLLQVPLSSSTPPCHISDLKGSEEGLSGRLAIF